MTGQGLDGVYSVVASAIGGNSLAVIKIENGSFTGNDSAGSRWSGKVQKLENGNVQFDATVTFGPNVFGVWGTSPTETFQTRSVSVELPASVLDGNPYVIPSFDLTIIFRPLSEDFAVLAGPDGLATMIYQLQAIQDAWRNFDAS